MPKVVDNYVLQQKIGSGQFGDVYKGYDQTNQMQVAIKAIRRQTIKGKFYQLLQNQIKVLKTCDNPNIIKLYAIKKTANHFYLVLEYCNEGDMLAYVRNNKVTQQQAIRFFSQILNGFQSLVKNRIMHRDFKLANILLHNGCIKIADFGFAKLLHNEDYTTTMLGSPLNMAPEVIGGNKYNSKADIWSIGACIYQIITGKPPFVAPNMVDLLKMIKSKPVSMPKINQTFSDVIKRMLVVDPKRRINWNDLFNHPINTFLAHQIQKQIDLEIVEDQSLLLNTSKYYLKKNLVINHPQDIHNNQQVNQYLYQVIQDGQKFKKFQQSVTTTKKVSDSEHELKTSKVYRQNSKKILYYRNIYAFLATVADQTIRNSQIKYNEVAGYMLTQKILKMIIWLRSCLSSNKCQIQGLQKWQSYILQTQFQEINKYVQKQYQVFEIFSKSLEPLIKTNILKSVYPVDVSEFLIQGFKQQTYQKYIFEYVKALLQDTTINMLKEKKINPYKPIWKHIEEALLARGVDRVFNDKNFEYNFKDFYQREFTLQQIMLRVQKILQDII